MYYLVFVDVLGGYDELVDEALHLGLGEALSSLEQFVEALAAAEFEQNVHVFFVFEVALELHDARVLQ